MKKPLVLVISIIVIIILCLVLLFAFQKKEESTTSNNNNIVSEIEKYHYVLEDNKSSLYKKYFNTLSKTTDEQETISLIAQLFLTDFYTLQGKENKIDIGGIQFLYPSIQDNFILKAQNTIYKYISSMDKEKLPMVTNVKVNTQESYSIDSFEKAYQLTLQIDYAENLGYPINVTMIIIKEKEQFYIVEID